MNRKNKSNKKIKNMPGYYLGTAKDGDKAWLAANRPEDKLMDMKKEEFFDSEIKPGTMIGLDSKNNGMFLGFLKGAAVAFNFKNNTISSNKFKEEDTVSIMKSSFSKKIGALIKEGGSKLIEVFGNRRIPGTDVSINDVLYATLELSGRLKAKNSYDINEYVKDSKPGDIISLSEKDGENNKKVFLHERDDDDDFGIKDFQEHFKDVPYNAIENGDSTIAVEKKRNLDEEEKEKQDREMEAEELGVFLSSQDGIKNEVDMLLKVLMAGKDNIVVEVQNPKKTEVENNGFTYPPPKRVIKLEFESTKVDSRKTPNKQNDDNSDKDSNLDFSNGEWIDGKWIWSRKGSGKVQDEISDEPSPKKTDYKTEGLYKQIYGKNWKKFLEMDQKEYDNRLNTDLKSLTNGSFVEEKQNKHIEYYVNRMKEENPSLTKDKAIKIVRSLIFEGDRYRG